MKKFALNFFIIISAVIPAHAQPVPYEFGIIYTKNSWTTTSDFITNGNSSAVLNGSYVNISSANTYDWANTIYITNYQTKLENWRFKARFKIISWAPDSYGIGFGVKSANAFVQNDVSGFVQTTSIGTGTLYIVKSGQNILSTGSTPLGVTLNDVLDVEGIFDDSIFTFTANNLTSGSSANVSYSYASNGSTYVVPNSGYFSLLELGGTHQIQSIEISSTETAGANIAAIGDSKTIGYFANSFGGRYAAQLNNSYPIAIINAGGGDRVTHALARQVELERLAANKYLLSIGSNDLRFGGTLGELQTNYNLLVGILQATGASVYHIVIPEDYTKPGTVNLIAFKNWIASSYSSFYIDGIWDSLSTGNILKDIYDTGDGIHLTQSANDKIYQAIVASGKLSNVVLPVKLYSFEARKINSGKVFLSWKTDPFEQAEKYSLLKSNDGINFAQLAEISSNTMGIYSYTDEQLFAGNNYYKLKMTEADGTVTYSRVITVHYKKMHPEVLTFRKINSNELILLVDAPVSSSIEWQMTDIGGRRIAKNRLHLTAGRNTITIPLSPLNSGMYYLQIISDYNDPVTTIPFIK